MIAFDSAGAGGNVNPGTSISWSHTCGGSNRLLVVVVENNVTDDVTVTYNGVSMTKYVTISASERLTYFYLKNPASGTNTVLVSKGASEQMVGISASYTGVLQTGGADANSSNLGTGTTFTSTTTTVADNCWVIEGHRWQAGSETTGANTTNRTGATSVQIEDNNTGKIPAGNVSLTINGSSSNWLYIAASFAPAPQGGAFLTNFI